MKTCNKCQRQLPSTNFYKNNSTSDKLYPSCKECNRVHNAVARKRNPKRYSDVRKSTRVARRARFDEWKKQQKCVVCDENYVRCLDLHHLDPSQKDKPLSNMAPVSSWDTVMKEVAKCVVLCRNCHAKVHDGIIILDCSRHGV